MHGQDLLLDCTQVGRILLNSSLLDMLPGGLSIATDASCQTVIHNSVAASFLRVEPFEPCSSSSAASLAMRVFQDGRLLTAEEMPLRRAAISGEDVIGCRLEFVWDDGIAKIGRWNASPLRDRDGEICGCIATVEDISFAVRRDKGEAGRGEYPQTVVDHRTAAAVEQADDRFLKVFRKSPQIMAIRRLSDKRLIDANDRFLSLVGLPLAEVIGKTPQELGMRRLQSEDMIATLSEVRAVENVEVRISLPDATEVTLLVSMDRIGLGDDECVLISAFDITAIKQMEVELARLDRMNLVGQMAAGIGHEIRNPLTVVRGYLQLWGQKPEFAPHRLTLQTMINEIDRANGIISQVLSLARSKQEQVRPEDINSIVRDLYPVMETEAFAQHKRVVFFLTEVPAVPVNPKEISQLVLNLFQNGLDAMPDGGAITIRTVHRSGQVVLSVQDQGTGISPEHVKKLGTPFFTTKDHGTGLSLAVCYNIVQRHGGRIDVKSGPEGTTFLVSFPTLEQA